jgi:cation transport regulator
MPYARITELPESVKGSLPNHAKAIYKEAFNNAWGEYKDPANRRDDASREEVSHPNRSTLLLTGSIKPG